MASAQVTTGIPVVPLTSPPVERRLVTVLFCDMVGFTQLSERLDAEDVREIQAAYFGGMSAEIVRFGGTVEKYAGDAVLALFGVPTAHEDDAERAVLCALAVQTSLADLRARVLEQWQFDLAARVGVNTGEVVSGAWDAGGRQDLAVTGDAVNTAARFQTAAVPGEVLVGEDTMCLTQRRVLYGERRDLALKGKEATVPAYPALGVRERASERWEDREYVTPLVGRDRELSQLASAWQAAQNGEGRLVTIVGDAGVGKSRLIAELVGATASDSLQIPRGRCLSYGQQISLWLIADLLRTICGLREQDSPDDIRTTLAAAIDSLLSECDTETRMEALDVLGEVLGQPIGTSMVANSGAQVRRQTLLRSLRSILGALSDRGPTIVLLEDLHWIDEASQDVLTEIMSDVPGLRLLVLVAQRPGWNPPWSEWGWTERLTLRPLQEEDAAVLAGAILGGIPLSEALQQYVADRAGGNPFFVEEMLRALQEAGGLNQQNGMADLVPGAAEKLPSTLTEVLLARLDRLEAQVRAAAQVASVIGRNFAVRLLARIVGQEATALEMPLTALQRAEIAFPRRGSDLEYIFKHVTMRDVAYNTLLQKRRQELHLQTAHAIAELYPPDEYVEMIAYHYSRTQDNVEAADWLERAGDRAAGVFANDAAIDYYREARRRLELTGAEPPVLARIDEKLGAVLATLGRSDEALQALEAAVDVFGQANDVEAVRRGTARIGRVHVYKGTLHEGLIRLRPMMETLSSSNPSHGLASLCVTLSQVLFMTGEHAESHQAAKRGAEIARTIGDELLLAEAEERRGTALQLLGQVEESRRVLEGAIGLAEAVGHLHALRRGLGNLGEAHRLLGDLDAARRYNQRVLEICERVGDPFLLVHSLANIAEILIARGDWLEAREILARAVETLPSVGPSYVAAYPPVYFGQLTLAEGDLVRAGQYLMEALTIAEATGDHQVLEFAQTFLAELDIAQKRPEAAIGRLEPLVEQGGRLGLMLPVLAQARLDSGHVAEAASLATKAVERAREGNELLALVNALRMQGVVMIRQEQWEEARQVLDEGLSLARAMPYPYAEARILYECGMMLGHREAPKEVRERPMREALAIFERLGAKRDVERIVQLLAANVASLFYLRAAGTGGEEMPQRLTGMTAGQVEGDALKALSDPPTDREEAQPEGTELQVGDVEPS